VKSSNWSRIAKVSVVAIVLMTGLTFFRPQGVLYPKEPPVRFMKDSPEANLKKQDPSQPGDHTALVKKITHDKAEESPSGVSGSERSQESDLSEITLDEDEKSELNRKLALAQLKVEAQIQAFSSEDSINEPPRDTGENMERP
jgi:hypothetical protein